MPESNVSPEPLNMRQVGDFVVNRVDNYSFLNSSEDGDNANFLKLLSQFLSNESLEKSDKVGFYSSLHLPEGELGGQTIAIKILEVPPPKLIRNQIERMMERADFSEKMQQTMENNNIIHLEGGEEKTQYNDLSEDEKYLVYMAWEHIQHEQLYSPYVLPTAFVSFTSKQGEKLYASIQNFLQFEEVDFTKLSEKQLSQLEDFLNKYKQGYEENSFYADPALRDPDSENLQFTRNGNLVLVDTNSLKSKNGIDSMYHECVTVLSSSIEKSRENIRT